MKTLLKIIGALFALLIVIFVGLNLYFTNERLKSTVMPYVNQAVGRPVHVESMSVTFLSTFPRPGLNVHKLSILDENDSDTLLTLDKLVVGVKLSSLFGDEISISEIQLDRPRFIYTIYEDGSSNVDFLISEEADADTTEGYAVSIPYFEITNGRFGYRDHTSDTDIRLNDFNAGISLRYADLIESTVDIELGGLYVSVGGNRYVSDLPMSLSEESTVDLDNEIINLQTGTLSIRGLALNLSGSINNWSSSLFADLSFNSTSDNFGELLRLVPIEYEQYTEGLETRGSLDINGSLNGILGGDELPAFQATIAVEKGYVKNPELPEPIEDIYFSAEASNERLIISRLDARAGSNNLTAAGQLERPLDEDGAFSFTLNSNVDLATVSSFYDLQSLGIESMSGRLDVGAQADGNRSIPEQATFNTTLRLEEGVLKYEDVPRPIENININADANQDVVIVRNVSLEASDNTFSMKGMVANPLKEDSRSVDLNANLRFDLATIKDFYPISEDTLQMSGLLTARATLKGKAAEIEHSVQNGVITLSNGLIDYKGFDKPFRDITLKSELNGHVLTITDASFVTGDNNLKASGHITDYLSENRTVDLKLEGSARLNEITNYYDLKPAIAQLTGNADLNFRARGPLNSPERMAFNGRLKVSGVNIRGDSLVQPVHDLNGELALTPSSVSLTSLSFKLGSSDIELNGSLNDYMEYLKAPEHRKATPHLTGSYHSDFLNVDELIDWEEESSSDPVPIHLPDLTSSVTASVGKMVVTGVTMHNLKAKASTTPGQIRLDQAGIELFGGKASGSFTWDVPQPDHTIITFKGSLANLQSEAFFKEFQVLGEKSNFHEHVSGAFSTDLSYYSELDVYLNPLLKTTEMKGNFGMTKSRLSGHPLQNKLADLFKAGELRNAVLDQWESTFTVDDRVLTLKDLRLTSGDIGVELDGTQHLVDETIDYKVKAYLPGRYKSAIASVITKQAADALTQQNGTLVVPLHVRGTLNNPGIQPDQDVIRPIVQNYLKDRAQDALKNLFGRDN